MAVYTGILSNVNRNTFRKCFFNSQSAFLTLTASKHTGKYPQVPPNLFTDIEMPEFRDLPEMAKIPQYYINQKPPLLRKSHAMDLRGPEKIHNTLLHKQYGIIALSAGYILQSHSEILVSTINREMDKKRMFAMWRVDPLWKPITKKGIGKRMGGGKPNVHHYASPVRAGRIVIEVGGKCEFEEVFPFLNRAAKKMPFDAMPIKYEMLEQLEREAEELHRNNVNPFSFRHVVINDMQGCNMWTSPWDHRHYDEYI